MNTGTNNKINDAEVQSIKELQKALDDYVASPKTAEQIGLEYERYIGYLCTKQGYYVDYNGIKRGKADGGIDLIAKNLEHTLLIQCKRWGKNWVVREKQIDQLAGSRRNYSRENKISEDKIKAVLVTTTAVSDEGKAHAKNTEVIIKEKFYQRDYPRVKGYLFYKGDDVEKEYRLPFDEKYDSDYPYTYFWSVYEAEMHDYERYNNRILPQAANSNEVPKPPKEENQVAQHSMTQQHVTNKQPSVKISNASTSNKKATRSKTIHPHFLKIASILISATLSILLLREYGNYRNGLDALAGQQFEIAQSYFNKLTFVQKYLTSEIEYANAGVLMEQGKYIEALNAFEELGSSVPSSIIDGTKNEIYKQAKIFYRSGSYSRAEGLFKELGTYKDTIKYLTLIAARNEETNILYENLLRYLNFEDTKEIIIQSAFYTEIYLRGTWRTAEKYYHLQFDKDGYMKTNLPQTSWGNSYVLEGGILSIGKKEYKKNFIITISTKDKIEVYCYKDEKTYIMIRD